MNAIVTQDIRFIVLTFPISCFLFYRKTIQLYSSIYCFLLQVIRPESSEDWTLQIKFTTLRDSGIYECQVNTEPKISMAFRLNIVGKYRLLIVS